MIYISYNISSSYSWVLENVHTMLSVLACTSETHCARCSNPTSSCDRCVRGYGLQINTVCTGTCI